MMTVGREESEMTGMTGGNRIEDEGKKGSDEKKERGEEKSKRASRIEKAKLLNFFEWCQSYLCTL